MTAHHALARPTRRLIGVVMLLALVLAGCASSDTTGDGGEASATSTESQTDTPEATTAPDDTVTEDAPATTEPEPAPGARTYAGTLGGGDIEGGCFWLDGEDGTRYELIAGTRSDVAIDQSNRVIADAEGNVVAREGDTVEVTGTVDEGMATFCQVGTVLVVDSVSAS